MSVRVLFLVVTSAACIASMSFAQSDASGAAAKVSLPATPATATSSPVASPETVPPAASQVPVAAVDTTQNAPKAAPVAPAQPKPPVAKPSGSKSADSSGHKPYVFGALDVVVIKVYEHPDLSGAFAITSDGFISLPVVGDIKADGLTAKELRDTLTERLKECCFNNLSAGEVDVQLGKNNSKHYYVFGAVGRTGEYPLDRDDLTIMEAMASVGGFRDDFAKKKKIRLLRGTETHMFNYVEVSHGKNMKQNIVIQNGDQIYVDE